MRASVFKLNDQVHNQNLTIWSFLSAEVWQWFSPATAVPLQFATLFQQRRYEEIDQHKSDRKPRHFSKPTFIEHRSIVG